jgi:lipopolysaccharide export system protein LptA
MNKKILVRSFLVIFFLLALTSIYLNYTKDNDEAAYVEIVEEKYSSSNVMKNVNYVSKDANGNEYNIDASVGEIDILNSDIIYLTDAKALIKLDNSNNIIITSDFGKYNVNNFNTIFSKNVIITYLENKITAEYLDLSIERNSMIISRNVVYTNIENILKADVIEMNIKTKDTKILMYEKEKKINIKSKN